MRGGFAPGDVAAIRTEGNPYADCTAVRSERGEWSCAHGRNIPEALVSARPLVVIDPEDRERVAELVDRYETMRPGSHRQVEHMRDALRSLVAPPRPPEPQGLGAVVEDATGQLWTRVERGDAITRNPWYPAAAADVQPAEYADITAARVLSEGVTE